MSDRELREALLRLDAVDLAGVPDHRQGVPDHRRGALEEAHLVRGERRVLVPLGREGADHAVALHEGHPENLRRAPLVGA